MAYSYVTYTGNGALTQFNVPFSYIRREHVTVLVNNVSQNFTWVNNGTVQLATAPANGASVKVARTTPVDAVLVDFVDGSTPVAADFDTSNLQHLFIEQELDDKAALAFVPTPSGLNAQNQPIINLANPNNAQDAATKSYVDTQDNLRLKRDGTDAMTGNLSMGGFKVTGLGTPTTGTDGTTKTYVDAGDAAVTAYADGAFIKLTTNQTVAGVKTFTSSPVVPAPVNNTDAATKAYVDTADATRWNKTTETIDSTEVWSNSDVAIATTSAINARIVDLLNDIGSYQVVATEVTFPNAGVVDLAGQPDAGVLVAVTDATGLAWNASGTSTNATTVNATAVTITGITGTSPITNCGMQVLSTGTLHTYTFVRFTVGTAVAQIISDNINEILQVDTNTAAAQAASAAAAASQSAAAASQASATASATLASDWAIKTNGAVAGGEFSAKYHAQAAASSATSAQTIVTTINAVGYYLSWGSITVAAGAQTTNYGTI